MRYFNTEGRCRPDIHYMVSLDDRLDKIKKQYVDKGKYFIINKGRQYGKTTTLMALAEYLKKDYTVVPMDFQALGTDNFADGPTFAISFIEYLEEIFSRKEGLRDAVSAEAYQYLVSLKYQQRLGLDKLFRGLSEMCKTAKKPVVMMIDEVDSASNNQIFIDFLAQLRRYYLDRESSPIFHSVILVGVYDVKNLKLKIRPDVEHQYNSPWNTREDNEENVCLHTFDECTRDHREQDPYDIAARFNIELSFSAEQITQMLQEYEADHNTGMDAGEMAQCIYAYTCGYPYLVSAICKFLDEEIPDRKGFEDCASVWTGKGVEEAVKMLLNENVPLFDSMVKQLDLYPELRDVIEQILYQGREISFTPGAKPISLGLMFGFLKENNGYVVVANRIFEMCLLSLFMAEESIQSDVFMRGQNDKNQFIQNGRLDMERVLEKFVEYFHDIYGDNDVKFIEKYGRKFFLLYLKPIINGTGNYYLEAQTRDAKRTDLVVDYLGEQFVVEMKIWHGNEYNERGERQLAEYLDYFRQQKGYMLSFNFNKNKKAGVKTISVGERIIVEAVV